MGQVLPILLVIGVVGKTTIPKTVQKAPRSKEINTKGDKKKTGNKTSHLWKDFRYTKEIPDKTSNEVFQLTPNDDIIKTNPRKVPKGVGVVSPWSKDKVTKSYSNRTWVRWCSLYWKDIFLPECFPFTSSKMSFSFRCLRLEWSRHRFVCTDVDTSTTFVCGGLD